MCWKLGQKQGMWTEESNRRCVEQMDTDHDGSVDKEEFVRHFNEVRVRGVH